MPDELLLNPLTFNDFLQTALDAGFDAAIGWDMPVYIDVPREESWKNLRKSLELTETLAEHIPTIPLSKGVDREQIDYCVTTLKNMGFSSAALHASEYVYYYRTDPLARKLMHTHLEYLTRSFDEVLVIGALHPIILKILERRYTGLRHASATWQTRAEKLEALTYTGFIDLKRRDIVCHCPACKGNPLTMRWRDDYRRLEDHNLAASAMLAHRQPFPLRAYDYVAQGRTIIAADIHLGEPGTRLNELSNLILEEKAKNTILLGDTLNPSGKIGLHQLYSLFYAPRMTGSSILLLKGDTDANPSQITALVEKLLRETTSTPIDHPLHDTYTRDALWLHRLYRAAPKTATVILPGGAKAVLTHRLADTPDEAVRKARALKRSRGADIAIAAHLHTALALPHEGIYLLPPCTGSQDPYLALLVEEDGEISLEEWEKWKR